MYLGVLHVPAEIHMAQITCGAYLQYGDVVLVVVLRIVSRMYGVLEDLSPLTPCGQDVGAGKHGEVFRNPGTHDTTLFIRLQINRLLVSLCERMCIVVSSKHRFVPCMP